MFTQMIYFKLLIFIISALFSANVVAQHNEFYQQVTNFTNRGNKVVSAFSENGKHLLAFNNKNFTEVNLVLFDSNLKVELTKSIPTPNVMSYVTRVSYFKGKFAIAFNEYTQTELYPNRLVIVDENLSILKDTIQLDTNRFKTQALVFLEEVDNRWIGILNSSDSATKSEIFEINEDLSIRNLKAFDSVFLSRCESFINQEYILHFKSFQDSARTYSNYTTTTDNKFNLKKHFDTDSTWRDTSYFVHRDTILNVLSYTMYKEAYDIYHLGGDTVLCVSAWTIDSAYYPEKNHETSNEVIRLAWFKNGGLIAEKFVGQGNREVLSVYENRAVLSDGSVIVAGTLDAPKNYSWVYNQTTQIVIAKYSRDAELIWRKTISLKNGYYLGHKLTISPNGIIAISGTYFDYKSSNNDYYANVIFLNEKGERILNAISDFQNQKEIGRLFPNPANASFSISGIKGATTLIVYSFNGQKQIEQSMNQTESVDISNLPNGTYVVVVQNKEGVFREKLVVQR